jgi:spermidine/putrescine-binding protein
MPSLEYVYPEEGIIAWLDSFVIPKNAKNPEAAKLWYDWALQPETQEIGPKYGAYQAPTIEGAEPFMPELLKVNLIDYDFQWCGEHKKEFVDKFTNEIAGAEDLKK